MKGETELLKLRNSPDVNGEDQAALTMRLMCMSNRVSPESERVGRQYAVPGSFNAKATTIRSLLAVGSSISRKVKVGAACASDRDSCRRGRL